MDALEASWTWSSFMRAVPAQQSEDALMRHVVEVVCVPRGVAEGVTPGLPR